MPLPSKHNSNTTVNMSRKKNTKSTIKPNDRNRKGCQITRRSTPLKKSAISTPIHHTKNSNNILSTPLLNTSATIHIAITQDTTSSFENSTTSINSILTKVCKIEERFDNLSTIIEKYFTEFTVLKEVVKELRSGKDNLMNEIDNFKRENVSLQPKLERKILHLEREPTVPTEHEGEQEENVHFTILVSNRYTSLCPSVKKPPSLRTESAVAVDKNKNVQRTNNIGNPNNKKKLLVCGDSHVKRLSKLLLNNSLEKSHAVLKDFDGANIKRLSDHILPYLHEDKPDSVILHIGTKDIQPNMDSTPEKLSDEIINLSQICKQSGVKNVYVSSILPKNDSRLSHFVSKVNNLLADKCKRYDVIFIFNESIRTGYLAKDGIHLNDILVVILLIVLIILIVFTVRFHNKAILQV